MNAGDVRRRADRRAAKRSEGKRGILRWSALVVAVGVGAFAVLHLLPALSALRQANEGSVTIADQRDLIDAGLSGLGASVAAAVATLCLLRLWWKAVSIVEAATIVGVLIVALWFLAPHLITAEQPYEVLNTLFSGLAFAGVVVAILLQREELALQRQELAETRAELARAARAQEALRVATLMQAHATCYAWLTELSKRVALARFEPHDCVGILDDLKAELDQARLDRAEQARKESESPAKDSGG